MRKKKNKSHMVKRQGHMEKFDERKLYASIFASCLAAQIPERESEKISDSVSKQVIKDISKKDSITAHYIYMQVMRNLKKKDENAAFMYDSHMDIS